jgi:hypothetical protein
MSPESKSVPLVVFGWYFVPFGTVVGTVTAVSHSWWLEEVEVEP